MFMIIIGVITFAFGLYDYKNPNSKWLRFLKRTPIDASHASETKSGGAMGMGTGLVLILIGFVSRLMSYI
ncbi:hypothetical protein ACK8P5_06250 [Paenibacillus sp. EC2-1]|uniref:hypothetical protein n=1 Tax=Paenibacillus sp. EC2-1 TaxID=3388665 RepID=UPI003BEEE96C